MSALGGVVLCLCMHGILILIWDRPRDIQGRAEREKRAEAVRVQPSPAQDLSPEMHKARKYPIRVPKNPCTAVLFAAAVQQLEIRRSKTKPSATTYKLTVLLLHLICCSMLSCEKCSKSSTCRRPVCSSADCGLAG